MANSVSELINEVRNIKGCKFAHIQYVSEEKLPKYLGLSSVKKRVSVMVQVNFDYERAVNNRLEKIGQPRSFRASVLPWGVWDTFNKVIENKGKYYLRYYEVKGETPDVEWFVDGRKMTDTEFATMMAYKQNKSKGSAKQSAEGLTDNQVTPKNVEFVNIESFKCGEVQYEMQINIAV